MVSRLAAAMSLIVFAVCLVVGGIGADNPFSTTVGRAMLAMLATLVIGLLVGAMANKMLEENLKIEKDKLKNDSAKSASNDR